MSKIAAVVIGSGNIGTDLMIKLLRRARNLEPVAMVGIDPTSRGLAQAAQFGLQTTAGGIEAFLSLAVAERVRIAFDATSAGAHAHHNEVLARRGIRVIDLTPAAIGPYCVPVVNIEQHLDAPNLNMVTCGGQATIPMVNAVSRVARVYYAEIVASIASVSAGPGTRANIDEFTATTARGIERIGGAEHGKAIIVLNPAEPPLLMRNTVYCLSEPADRARIERSIVEMVGAVQAYVPGYRLKQKVQFEEYTADRPLRLPGMGAVTGLRTSVFLEVEGAGHHLPAYAGNLDIMTSAALAAAEQLAARLQAGNSRSL